jgi:transcriptional regulator with XRE-family HTH domain
MGSEVMSYGDDATINRHIGAGLSLARIVRGLSQAELATAVGNSAPRIAAIERGEVECTARELYSLAEALGVPVDYFFDGLMSARPEADSVEGIATSA